MNPPGHTQLPPSLRHLVSRRDTWLGRSGLSAANGDEHHQPHLRTGFAALDAQLRAGGWPLGSSIEVLSETAGLGAMGLFLPAMETLRPQQRWLVFIAPPHTPYAPLLEARGIDVRQVLLVHPRNREELLWSTEQALRSSTCAAVFSWLGDQSWRYAELRRLQLAASEGDGLGILFRHRQAAHEHAPAALRLEMRAYREVHILKQRGGQQGIDIYLPPEDDIPQQPQLWELPADNARPLSPVAAPA